MPIREIDAITDAIIETEREIAGEAWGEEDTERADSSGDRSLESIGDGLEGQHEAEGDDEAAGEEAEGDEETEGEGEEGDGDGEGEGAEGAAATTGKTGEGEAPKPGEQQRQPEGRVPPGRLREAAERARLAEAERDRLQRELETERTGRNSDLEALKTQVSTLTQLLQGQRQQPPAREQQQPPPKTEPVEAPDIFENPKGFVDHFTSLVQSAVGGVRQDMRAQRVETSMAIAHATHKDAFEKAFDAVNQLNPDNADDRATVQRIYGAPNPGEALVAWHKRNQTLARVGDDPDVFIENVRKETRDALIKDPEFRKQLIAEMRGEAQRGGSDGGPRTETRLPKSLARAGGSNLGADRVDQHARDDSEQAVADAAWR